VATKSDKLSGNQRQNALHNLAQELEVERIVTYSARTGAGRDELWQQIRAATADHH